MNVAENRFVYGDNFQHRPPPKGPLAAYVNGYGVPADIATDGNYGEYLSSVFTALDALGSRVIVVYLCGGYTNRQNLSEAEAMMVWVEKNVPEWKDYVRLIENATTVRENVAEFAAKCWAANFSPVLFCEYSREPTVAALAAVFFGGSVPITTAGVRFSASDLTPRAQMKQVLVNLPVELLSLQFDAVERWRAKARAAVIANARAQAAKERKGPA
ncbi:hypothetical protein KBB27_04265 [Patescibacteria group bacterium]|nr:hypothetical protein [Patescibacteria group bacterium]